MSAMYPFLPLELVVCETSNLSSGSHVSLLDDDYEIVTLNSFSDFLAGPLLAVF